VTKRLILTITALFLFFISEKSSDTSLKASSLQSELSIAQKDTTANKSIFDIISLGQYVFPIKGKVISPYGRRGRRFHPGTDIKLQLGDTVRAMFKGVVTRSGRYYGYGLLVILKHPNDIETYYAHLSKCIANVGDTVSPGDVLGLGGRTGRATTTHLHFEIRYHAKAYNAQKLFDFEQQKLIAETYTEETAVKLSDAKSETLTNPLNIEDKTHEEKIYHIIKKGDTLFSLAKKYSTTVNDICELNHISTKTKLKIGRKLKMQ
jgi:murein DD-endopeptidase MepM/ murein hydrolase activator NlpD